MSISAPFTSNAGFKTAAVIAILVVGSAVSLSISLAMPSIAHARGGISGGGGNMIEPKAISIKMDVDLAKVMVHQSHEDLDQYISLKKSDFKQGKLSRDQMRAFAPVFNSQHKIEEVMDVVNLHVETNSPCFDAQLKPVDGSIYTNKLNSVCVSAFNITNKADATDVLPQANALVLHEYCEVMQLTEDEAVRVQTEALKDFRKP
jgi:signal-transduction protein with cAMP-binding, CBS, and nucleotidyltransferase domain